MNKFIKVATVKRFHYERHAQININIKLFIDAYNCDRRLKTLRGLTPAEFIHLTWTKDPERFMVDPSHLTLGP